MTSYNDKVPTLDGRRTPVSDLNTGVDLKEQQPEDTGGLRGFFRKLNLVMAGMYTGLNCYGTPHTHHSYKK